MRKVIEPVDKEFVKLSDGFYYFMPTDGLAYNSLDLRDIAKALDDINTDGGVVVEIDE